jgi:hypothetical protein
MTPTFPDNWFPKPNPVAAESRNEEIRQPKPRKAYENLIERIASLDPVPLVRCSRFLIKNEKGSHE